MSRSWRSGSSRRWRRLRALVLADNLARNAGRCTLGIAGVCTGQADTVHHTLGRAVTGDDPKYLAAVCGACNLHVGEPARSSPRPRPVSKW
jgi:hypothetical protein